MAENNADLRLHHAEDRIKHLQRRVAHLEKRGTVSEYAICMLLLQNEYLMEILGRETVLKGVKMSEVETRIREKNILSSFSAIAPDNLKEVISNAKRAIQGRALTVSEVAASVAEAPQVDLSSDLFADTDTALFFADPANDPVNLGVIEEDEI